MTGIANVGAIKRYENPGARYKSGVLLAFAFRPPFHPRFCNHTRNHSARGAIYVAIRMKRALIFKVKTFLRAVGGLFR